MSGKICAALKSWLDAGLDRIGEICILREGGGFVLVHHEDAAACDVQRGASHRDAATAPDLQIFTRATDALEISRYDQTGEYRPLKTAPNLKRGWKLMLEGQDELHAALDFFYPAMVGVRVAFLEGKVKSVDFRETAARQSGMYDVVKKITDEQADALTGDFCRSDGRCLKTILWQLDRKTPLTKLPASKFDPEADQTGSGKNTMPLFCTEACNLLVAAARETVLKSRKKT